MLAERNEYLHERYLYLSFFYLLTYLLSWPRNEYAVKLGYDKIEFSDVNHITPPRPILPYSVRYNGDILVFRGVKPHGAWARYPVDVCITTSSIDTQFTVRQRRMFDASVQTDNPGSDVHTDKVNTPMQVEDPDITRVEEDRDTHALKTKEEEAKTN